MDVFHVFQRRIAVGFERLKTAHADALRVRSAGEVWLSVRGVLATHTAPSRAAGDLSWEGFCGPLCLQLCTSVNQIADRRR